MQPAGYRRFHFSSRVLRRAGQRVSVFKGELLSLAPSSTKIRCRQGDNLLRVSCSSASCHRSGLSCPSRLRLFPQNSAPLGLLQPPKARFPSGCLKLLWCKQPGLIHRNPSGAQNGCLVPGVSASHQDKEPAGGSRLLPCLKRSRGWAGGQQLPAQLSGRGALRSPALICGEQHARAGSEEEQAVKKAPIRTKRATSSIFKGQQAAFTAPLPQNKLAQASEVR